jgi:hypothetical protein
LNKLSLLVTFGGWLEGQSHRMKIDLVMALMLDKAKNNPKRVKSWPGNR